MLQQIDAFMLHLTCGIVSALSFLRSSRWWLHSLRQLHVCHQCVVFVLQVVTDPSFTDWSIQKYSHICYSIIHVIWTKLYCSRLSLIASKNDLYMLQQLHQWSCRYSTTHTAHFLPAVACLRYRCSGTLPAMSSSTTVITSTTVGTCFECHAYTAGMHRCSMWQTVHFRRVRLSHVYI
jgi:hypothetical protein